MPGFMAKYLNYIKPLQGSLSETIKMFAEAQVFIQNYSQKDGIGIILDLFII